MLRSRISSHVVDVSQASRSSCFDINITGARNPNGSKTLAAERNKSLLVVPLNLYLELECVALAVPGETKCSHRREVVHVQVKSWF